MSQRFSFLVSALALFALNFGPKIYVSRFNPRLVIYPKYQGFFKVLWPLLVA